MRRYTPKNLLTVDANAKTVKGQRYGFMTGILYLAPSTLSGHNVCPTAHLAQCDRACLNTAGRGAMSNVQNARLNKTLFFFENRDAFMALLVADVARLVRRAARKGMIPLVRLNGTSDIRWETIPTDDGRTIFERFPDVQEGRLTELSPTLNSLTPFIDQLTVISNTELKMAYSPGNHATANSSFLSASKAKMTEGSDYYLATTVDQIAAKCGLSKPNLLYYFRRKEDIYLAVLEHTLHDWLEPLRSLDAAGEPIDEITRYIRTKIRLSRDNPKASRLFANEILHGAAAVGPYLKGPLKDLVDEKAAIIRNAISISANR